MGLIEMVPKVVEIQHTCHCKTTAEEPAEGEPEVHLFTVDGVEFPWYTSEGNPKVSRIHNDFYMIEVDVLLLDKESKDFLSFGYNNEDGCNVPSIPIIGGVMFPWLLHEDGCVLTFGHKVIPSLNLKFFTLQVITNLDVTDERPKTWSDSDDVYCSGGHLIATENESMFDV